MDLRNGRLYQKLLDNTPTPTSLNRVSYVLGLTLRLVSLHSVRLTQIELRRTPYPSTRRYIFSLDPNVDLYGLKFRVVEIHQNPFSETKDLEVKRVDILYLALLKVPIPHISLSIPYISRITSRTDTLSGS